MSLTMYQYTVSNLKKKTLKKNAVTYWTAPKGLIWITEGLDAEKGGKEKGRMRQERSPNK